MISFDSKAQNLISSGTSISFSLTNTAGNLVVAMFLIRDNATSISGTPTYGGQNMTQAKRQVDAGNAISCEIWYIVGAPTGSNTLSATISNSGIETRTIVSSYTAVLSSSPLDQTGGANGATSVNITPGANNELIVACAINEDGTTPAVGSGETLLNGNDEGTWATGGEYVIKSGGSGVAHTMDFGTWDGTQGCIAAASFKESTSFPTVQSTTDTDFGSSVTNMDVNMPATVNSGDRLIALVSVRNSGTWSTIPTGWSQLKQQLGGGGSVGQTTVFEKIADGTEGGTTPRWTASASTTAAWQVIRITGAHASTASEVTSTSGDSSAADPPSITASWGADNNLFIAVAGHAAASATPWSAGPASYASFALNGASSGGSSVAIANAFRHTTIATEDPGAFTVSGSNRFWTGETIVVRPAAGGGGGGSTPRKQHLQLLGVG